MDFLIFLLNSLIEILPYMLIMLGYFLVSAFFLSKFVFKPTLAILAERHKRMGGMNKEAEYFQSQVEGKLSEYEGLMEEARNLARAKRETLLKEAEEQRREILVAARSEAETKLNAARADLEAQVQTAQGQLKGEAQKIASEIVEKVLDKKVA